MRRTVRLRAVLDDGEPVSLGDVGQRVHVDRVAEEVNRDDRACPRRDEILDEVEVEVPGRSLRVDRDRDGAVVVGGESGGDVGRRADEDFVAGAESSAWTARWSAVVPLEVAMPWRVPTKSANSRSKAGRFSPKEPEISPARTAAATASASSSPMNGS